VKLKKQTKTAVYYNLLFFPLFLERVLVFLFNLLVRVLEMKQILMSRFFLIKLYSDPEPYYIKSYIFSISLLSFIDIDDVPLSSRVSNYI